MKVLEIYNETRCIGRYFDQAGFDVYKLDYQNLNPDNINTEKIIKEFGKPDIIWITPSCSSYSMAGISHHRRKINEVLEPVSNYAKHCDDLNQKVIQLIKELNPKLYFIENPRAGLRKMSFMQDLPRYTITYCQYGDTRQKPTNIWTNHPNPRFKPVCHRGDPCHEAAPRGCTKSGTQRLKRIDQRRNIPELLCYHIIDLCKEI